MKLIESTENAFGGVIIEPSALQANPDEFDGMLAHSLEAWKQADYRVAWLQVPIECSQLIPIAVNHGFTFHHSEQDYLMMTHQLEEGAFVPAHASHYIGAGGVTINDQRELLVVSERYHRQKNDGPPRYKLPGGALHAGEHLVEGVIREVKEETGVDTEFDALVCFRHWHGYRYGKSDIYFVCRMHPVSRESSIQVEEIAESLWMPVDDYLGAENVSVFNKKIVAAAMDSSGISPTPVDGYGDPERYEFFMPSL